MKSNINMFKALFEVRTAKVSKSFFVIIISIIIVVLAGANIMGYIYFKVQTDTHNAHKAASELFITDPNNISKREEYNTLENQVIALKQYMTDTTVLEYYISQQPKFNTQFYGKLKELKPDSIEITSLSLNGGILTISCECASNDNGPPAQYAQALDNSKLFSDITYTGFAFSGNKYTFSVSCVY